jgi:hypothetical protein
MKLDIALVADTATVDASGKLNILGAFHRLRGPEFPLQHGRISLVLRFAPEPADTGDIEVQIRLMGPNDDLVLSLDGQVRAGNPPQDEADVRVPQVLNLDGVVFPEPGLYRFIILAGGREAGSVPLRVERAQMGAGGARGARPGSAGGAPIMVPPGSEGSVQA